MTHHPHVTRRTFGKISAAAMLAPLFARMQEAAAQDAATPSASPSASPAGVAVDVQLATMTLAPGSKAEGAKQDATLTLNLGNEIDSGDPQVFAYLNEIEIGSKVFAPLLALNEKNEIADCGADKVSVSGDGRVYTFHIREGMTYSDGQPCTAKNYAYALKRALDPAVAGNYSNILFAVSGAEKWRSADPKDAKTEELKAAVDQSIVAVDDQTLEIHLDFAAGYFPFVMATWVTYPVREDLVEGKGADWWKTPANYIGNGPFKLAKWDNGKEWVFERNDTYFRGAAGIKTLTFKEVDSAETEFLAYQQGELELIGPSSTQLPQIEADPKLKEQLHRVAGASTSWMAFNNSAKPFDDKKVRQAFSCAMNREQYIEQVLNGVGIPAGTFLYEGVPGYQTKVVQGYDAEKAKSLMKEAGYENGQNFPKFPLYYNSESAIAQQQATYWSQSFQQALGVTIEPSPLDSAQMQSLRTNRDPKLMIGIGNWFEDYPHPQNWLSLVFGRGSTRAPLGWNNEDYYKLVEEADRLPIEEATPLYEQADAMLAEETPVAFYMHGEGLVLISPKIKGYVSYPTSLMDTTYQIEKVYKTE